MKGFGALIKNENIKTVKQVSFRVLLIIFAGLLILVPAGNWVLSLFGNSVSYATSDWNLEMAQSFREAGETDMADYYMAMYEAGRFFDENNLKPDGVEYQLYYNNYENLYLTIAGLDRVAGMTDQEKAYNSMFWHYIENYALNKTDIIPELMSETYDKNLLPLLTPDVVAKLRTAASAEMAEIAGKVLDFNIKDYYEGIITSLRGQTAQAEATIKECNETLAADPDDTDTAYALEFTTLQLEGYGRLLTGYGYLRDHACEYNGWEYRTVVRLISQATSTLGNSAPSSEEEFRESYLRRQYATYADYVKKCEDDRENARQIITVALYSLENNNPLPEMVTDSNKLTWRGQLSAMISVSVVIMIVLAGTTVSHEYSSGTIRLLLIRPKKRGKILASKLASMLIFWAVMIIGATGVLLLMNIVFKGMGDLFVPDLVYSDSSVIKINSVLSTLGSVSVEILSAMIFVMLSFLLSVLVKKAALAIALPLIGYFFAGTAQLLAVVLDTELDLPFIAWTPLPYLDLSVFTKSLVSTFVQDFDIMNLTSALFTPDVLARYNIVIGLVYTVGIIVTAVVLSFVAFNRQQIKN